MGGQLLKELSLATLADIDEGRIKVAFDQAVARVLNDLADRPGENAVREINLKIAFKPVMEGTAFEGAKVQACITDKIPKRITKIYDMNARTRRGETKLMFHPGSPEDADQGTLPFPEDNS